jgi:hypothetical protein
MQAIAQFFGISIPLIACGMVLLIAGMKRVEALRPIRR